jgi:asparagine synthase (glutamine-hydrolysing)
MCGIAGFTHSRTAPAADRIQEITLALKHRGPDQQGTWESAEVSLGAVRLKIIDLEGGAQPMIAGGTTLVFNGEIYNHLEVRRELESLGHRFESRCDTETVLRAFLEWDVDSFARLRGMFAAAFWDESSRRLVLARDRMGIKPLYYHERQGEVYFGSELKAILLHPEIERALDPVGLDHYLSLNYVPGPYTLVEGIRKLPPGNYLQWRDGKISIEPYWKLEFRPDERLDFGAAKEELDQLLRSAVREHLISDVPLGVWSSGGLDSTTILHYAAEASPAKLKTFSVSFRGRTFDESAYFREVASRYGTDHHEFDLNPEVDIQSALEQFAWYSDEPSADAGAVPVWFLSKMCRSEVTVALSGDGADELFGGYNTYLADGYAATLRRFPMPLRKAAARMSRWLPVSDEKIGLDYRIRRMLEGSLLVPVDAHLFWNGTFSEYEKSALLTDSAKRQPARPAVLPGINGFIELDQHCYLPDDILYKCDRMSMAHSLEVRPPFLDHRIVEFAARLPLNMKIRGRNLKFILRDLMKDRLPKAVIGRAKEGFDIPTHHWLRTFLRPLVEETLSERNVRESGMFSPDAVANTVRLHMNRRANLGYHLWGLLILFLWMKHWRMGPPAGLDCRVPELVSVQ